MGPKKAPQARDNESTKKNNAVAGAVPNNSGKAKENYIYAYRRNFLTNNQNVSSLNHAKSRIPTSDARKKNQKQSQIGNLSNQMKSNGKISSATVKNAVNSNKNSSPNNRTTNNSLNKQGLRSRDKTGDTSRPTVNKNKANQSKVGKRVSSPPVHTVALIKDESKVFKQNEPKFEATEFQRYKMPAEFESLPDIDIDLGAIKQLLSNDDGIKETSGSCRSYSLNPYDTVPICSGGYNENIGKYIGEDFQNFLTYRNKRKMKSNANQISDLSDKTDTDVVSIKTDLKVSKDRKEAVTRDLLSKDVCRSDSSGSFKIEVSQTSEMSKESRKGNNDDKEFRHVNPIDLFEKETPRSEKFDGVPCSQFIDKTDVSSYYPEKINTTEERSINIPIKENEKEDKSVKYDLINLHSSQFAYDKRYDHVDNLKSLKWVSLPNDFKRKESAGKINEIKQTVSGTTVQSSCNSISFDTKTFIWENPIKLTNSTIEDDKSLKMKNGQIMRIKGEEMSVNKLEFLPSARLKCVVQEMIPKLTSDSRNIIDEDIQIVPEKDTKVFHSSLSSTDKCCSDDRTESEKIDTLTETSSKEHIFSLDCNNIEYKNTFQNLEEIVRNCNTTDAVNISEEIIFENIPEDSQFEAKDQEHYLFCDADDEFASESEDIYDSIECKDCVWVDYKTPIKNNGSSDEDDLWALEEIISSISDGDSMETEAMQLIEKANRHWTTTERNLEQLRHCLQECTEEAQRAAKEISSIKGKKYKLSYIEKIPVDQKINSYASAKRPEGKFNSNNTLLTINDFNDQCFSLMDDNNVLQCSKPRIEDDLDFFSLSSSDELCDIEIKKESFQEKPRKSFLSFGKSCVKMKQKKDKKKFMSIFNFFKL